MKVTPKADIAGRCWMPGFAECFILFSTLNIDN